MEYAIVPTSTRLKSKRGAALARWAGEHGVDCCGLRVERDPGWTSDDADAAIAAKEQR
jgi:hypothetical protein